MAVGTKTGMYIRPNPKNATAAHTPRQMAIAHVAKQMLADNRQACRSNMLE